MSEEWQVDERGRRFRRIGACIEYEPDVVSTFGSFPKSVYDRIEKPEPDSLAPIREQHKRCPFSKLALCSDECARYTKNGCGLVTGAAPTTGKRCPICDAHNPLMCTENCALWALCKRKGSVNNG